VAPRRCPSLLLKYGVRVNAVAPGPVWTPLIPTMPEQKVREFGKQSAMERPPAELAPAYVFLGECAEKHMIELPGLGELDATWMVPC
jgi:NAD(P)-dependent dehydrogenase (short-subunit alcohol dehydrogenase family)